MRRKGFINALLVGFLVTTATVAVAQVPAPPPDPLDPSFHWSSYSFTKTVRTQGSETHQIFGATLAANYRLPKGFRLYARVEATRNQDGGDVAVDIYRPDTYSDLEALGGVTYRLLGPLHLAAFGGASIPFVAGKVSIQERYPRTYFGGVSLGFSQTTWGYVGVGKHEPSGPGVRVLLAGQWRLKDRASLVGEAALGRGSYYRGGVAIFLAGTEDKGVK